MFLKLVFRGLSCVIFVRSDEWETEFLPKRGKEKNVTKEKSAKLATEISRGGKKAI